MNLLKLMEEGLNSLLVGKHINVQYLRVLPPSDQEGEYYFFPAQFGEDVVGETIKCEIHAVKIVQGVVLKDRIIDEIKIKFRHRPFFETITIPYDKFFTDITQLGLPEIFKTSKFF